MKLIGITGKAGSGKTAFSEYIAENNSKDIGIIHMDDLLNEVKLKYFRPFLKENNKGEKLKVDYRLKKFLYGNKHIFSIFMKLKAKILEPSLNRRIAELSKSKKIILIDDIFLQYHKIFKSLDQVYLIERSPDTRKQALFDRDRLSEEDIEAFDIAHNKANYQRIKEDTRTMTIKNDGDIEELKEKAKEIYESRIAPRREGFLKQEGVETQISRNIPTSKTRTKSRKKEGESR